MPLMDLKADAKLNLEALPPDMEPAIRQALENVWAWSDALVDALREEVVEELRLQGEAIDELIDNNDNVLHPELTARIVGVFEIGKLVCNELEKLLATIDDPEIVDDLTRKRIDELVSGYRHTAEVVTLEVSEYTVDVDDLLADDGQPGDGQADEGDEGDEDDEDDDDEPTPVEIPQRKTDGDNEQAEG